MRETTHTTVVALPSLRRIATLVLGGSMASMLVAGIYGGLLRLGIATGVAPAGLAQVHGPIMVSAFFGAVISMERAVAVRRNWAYIAPVCAAVGGVSLLALGEPVVAGVFFTVAALGLLVVFAHLLHHRVDAFTVVMALGALAWTVGNVAWTLGASTPEVVPWWAAFLVLTIAGERLELSRFRSQEQGRAGFWLGIVLIGAALVGTLAAFDPGSRVVGAGFVVVAVWLARHDVARSTIRRPGSPRYMAVALFAGYAWLAVAGTLAVGYGGVQAGWIYDAIWHAVFVGFVFSMVFAHAQVILPALTGIRVEHGPQFYVPLALLHLATALRVSGDLAASEMLRRAGGIGNALAIAIFAAVLVSSIRRARRARHG